MTITLEPQHEKLIAQATRTGAYGRACDSRDFQKR